jgi:hypothetical protein
MKGSRRTDSPSGELDSITKFRAVRRRCGVFVVISVEAAHLRPLCGVPGMGDDSADRSLRREADSGGPELLARFDPGLGPGRLRPLLVCTAIFRAVVAIGAFRGLLIVFFEGPCSNGSVNSTIFEVLRVRDRVERADAAVRVLAGAMLRAISSWPTRMITFLHV